MKKGFTLIELLAVIIILSLLALIISSGVTKIVKKSKADIKSAQELAIIRAAEIWSANSIDEVPTAGCMAKSFNELIDAKVLNSVNLDEYKGKDLDYMMVRICAEYEDDSENPTLNYNIVDVGEYLGCFSTTSSGSTVSIDDYRTYVDNDSSKGICPKDVIIPSIIKENGAKKNVTSITGGFSNKALTSVVLPTTIQEVSSNSFSSNSFVSLYIPKNINSIKSSSFQNCSQLKHINISNGVETIQDNAFSNDNLVNLYIPRSVTTIGNYAFSNNNLLSVSIDSNQTNVTLGNDVFQGFSGTIDWLREM